MDSDQTDQLLRCLYGHLARRLGFQNSEANRLAFWRWLARRRGETCERTTPTESPSIAIRYGLRRLD
jgi:hypothetical protein